LLGSAANERTPRENSKEFFLSSWFELGGKNGEIPPVSGFSLSLSTDQSLFLGLATAMASHNLWGSKLVEEVWLGSGSGVREDHKSRCIVVEVIMQA